VKIEDPRRVNREVTQQVVCGGSKGGSERFFPGKENLRVRECLDEELRGGVLN